MSIRKNQAFWTSVILHAVVLFALLLGVIIEAFKPKEKEHVFVMVSPPSESTPRQKVPTPNNPEPSQPQELDLPDIPDLTIPEPEPARPTPTPTPTPEPQPTGQLISYTEFTNKNPIKEPRQPRPTPPQPREEIKINPSTISVQDTYVPTSSTQQMSTQEKDRLLRYVAQISAILNRVWVKPRSLVGSDLKVVAIFYVDASGRISNIRFQTASGNAAFDTSVRQAFSKIRTAGPTPTGKGQDIKVSFNMLD